MMEASEDINDTVPNCEALVDANSSVLAEIAGQGVTVTDVSVTGTSAFLTGQVEGDGVSRFVNIGEPETVKLVEEGGTWKLDSLPDVAP